jgi:hypothetical protein
MNHNLAFYNSLRNRKNKFISLSRLMLEELKEFVFLNWQPKNFPLIIYYMGICSTSGVFSLDKINENMQWEVLALLLITWSNGTLWMVGFLLHTCTCVNSNLVADCLS